MEMEIKRDNEEKAKKCLSIIAFPIIPLVP